MRSKRGLISVCISLMVYANLTFADNSSTMLNIQQQWASINYEANNSEKEKAFIALIVDAEAFVASSNNSA